MLAFSIFLILSAAISLVVTFVGFFFIDFFVHFREGIFGLNVEGYNLFLIICSLLTIFLFYNTYNSREMIKEGGGGKNYTSLGKSEDKRSRGLLAILSRRNDTFSSKSYKSGKRKY